MKGILLGNESINEEFYGLSVEALKKYGIDEAYFEDQIYNRPSFEFLLHFLPHYPYEIMIPLKVLVEVGRDSSCFIIWHEGFNKFGIGATKEEAIEDFEHNVVTDYLILNDSDPGELSEDAKELLQLYRSTIKLN